MHLMKQILNKQISSTIFLSFMNHLLMPLRGLTPRCPFPYWPSITMTLIRVCANTTTPQLPWQILTVTFLWHPLTCSPLIHSQLFRLILKSASPLWSFSELSALCSHCPLRSLVHQTGKTFSSLYCSFFLIWLSALWELGIMSFLS